MPFLHCPVALCHIAALTVLLGVLRYSTQLSFGVFTLELVEFLSLLTRSKVSLTESSGRAGRKECFQLWGSLGVT